MFRRSVWAWILILCIMGAAILREDDMKKEVREEVKEDLRNYMLTKDYCSMDEFEDIDYYLFCSTQLHKGAGSFENRPSIIGSETLTIDEAKALYQGFLKKLPLDQEEAEEEGEEREERYVLYVSPDCKWVITNKWDEHKNMSTQTLFYEKEKVKEKVTENVGQNFVYPIMVVKDQNAYREMDEEQYKKLSEMARITFYDDGFNSLNRINAEGDLFAEEDMVAEINDDDSWLTIRKVEDETELWRFSLQGIREETARIRDDIQEGDIVLVLICQFEGNEKEGWLTVQAGSSSFFRIAYPSGEMTYLGEYMYSPWFSPDGKYVAYSSIDYNNGVGMEHGRPEEYAQTPPDGIYVREVETGKTAYIYWKPMWPEEDYMEYRNFLWIEKAAFEEYMGDTGRRE